MQNQPDRYASENGLRAPVSTDVIEVIGSGAGVQHIGTEIETPESKVQIIANGSAIRTMTTRGNDDGTVVLETTAIATDNKDGASPPNLTTSPSLAKFTTEKSLE